MIGTSYGIDAQVKILRAVAGDLYGDTGFFSAAFTPVLLDTRTAGRSAGLVSIDVQHSLASPAGRFKIELAPSTLFGDRLTVEHIAPYSLVAIALHRSGPRLDPTTTDDPEPVMLGLVDTVDITEDYGQAAPNRRQSISGRMLTGILQDHQWYLHRWAQLHNVPADFRQFYADPPDLVTATADEAALGSQYGLFSVNAELFNAAPLQHPIVLMGTVFDFYVHGSPSSVQGGGDRGPFIRVEFADGTTVADRLRFDAQASRAAFVDARAQMAVQYLPTLFPQANCWQVMKYFSPDYANELFAVVGGTSVDDAYVQIVSRKPPFAGHLVYDSAKGPLVGFSTGAEPPMYGASLFDASTPGWGGYGTETAYIDGTDIIAEPQMQRGVAGGGALFTLYDVQPMLGSPAGDKKTQDINQVLWPPLVDIDPASPGYVKRYGLRRLPQQLNYVAGVGPDDSPTQPDVLGQHCGAYQALYYTWFKRLADMWRGTFVLKGRTAFRIGQRLVDRSRSIPREYYITGVRHHVAFGPGPDGGAFTTTVQVERGWDLSPGAA